MTLQDQFIKAYKKHLGHIVSIADALSVAESTCRRYETKCIESGQITKFPALSQVRSFSEEDRASATELIEAWSGNDFNSSITARELNLSRSTFRARLDRAQRVLGTKKPALAPSKVPEGMKMHKTTVQLDGAGNVVQEWRRLRPDVELLKTVADELMRLVDSQAPALPEPEQHDEEELMLEIPLFDVHFGKLCRAEETGEDYNLAICEQMTTGVVARMLAEAG